MSMRRTASRSGRWRISPASSACCRSTATPAIARWPQRTSVQLAFCWAHVRRRFYELAAAGPAPIASEALERIARSMPSKMTSAAAPPRNGAPRASKDAAHRRRAGALAARKARVDQPEDQARRSDPLCAVALGRPDAFRRRRTHRNGLQRRRARDPPDYSQSQERVVRRFGRRRRALGDVASLIETCLCRARHNAVYAAR